MAYSGDLFDIQFEMIRFWRIKLDLALSHLFPHLLISFQ